MRTINLPDTPTDWIECSPVIVESGMLPSCTVIRKWNDVTPFAVHTAFVQDGKWAYTRGDYCRTIEGAQERYAARARC